MSSIYGDIAVRPQFIYDKYYPNRLELENNAETDGVFIGRYVLIDYQLNNNNNYKIDSDNKLLIDNISNDQTVWQKIWKNNKAVYILAARLNAAPPELQLKPLAPNDNKRKTVLLKDETKENAFNLYWQDPFNLDFSKIPEDIVNEKGFNPSVRNKVDGENYFKIISTKSGKNYYTDTEDTTSEQEIDTKRFEINLPGLGNAVSDIYDLLLSQNRDAVKLKTDNVLNEVDNPLKYLYYIPGEQIFYRAVYNVETKSYSFEKVLSLMGETQINSFFQLFLLFYNRFKAIEEDDYELGFISDNSMTKMLGYFDAEYIPGQPDIPEDVTQEDDFMIGTHTYNTTSGKGNHIITISNASVQALYPVVVKFTVGFTMGETITLARGTESSSYTLYMANGDQAATGAFEADTVGLICFDANSGKAYINSAVATWA